MTSFKDLFSVQASDYAKFRPRYTDDLFNYLSSLTKDHDQVWDVGTGNGQAAVMVAKYYKKVFATDPSEKQLGEATAHSQVLYRVGSAEKCDLPVQSVDLVTVAQAFHWFKQKEFFAEVKRVVKPGGVLAFWCYEMARINPAVDAAVHELYEGILGPYWEKERKLVEEGYANVQTPFTEITPPKFQLYAEWSFEQLLGYLSTWSALQTYIKKNGKNPLEDVYPSLKAAWGDDSTKPVHWDMGLRVVRI